MTARKLKILITLFLDTKKGNLLLQEEKYKAQPQVA